jgi:hypothetical protein
MDIISTVDVFETLAQGQRLGALGRSLRRSGHRLFLNLARAMDERRADVERGLTETGVARQAAWDAVLQTTSAAAAAHELLAQLGSVERRAAGLRAEVTDAANWLLEFTRFELPSEVLPADLRVQLDAIGGVNADPDRFARSLLGLGLASQADGLLPVLRSVTRLRLLALHGTVLGAITDASPAVDAATDAELTALETDVTGRVRALRDTAREAAERLRGGTATPAVLAGMWAALFRFETWLVTDAADRLAAAASAATARVAGDAADAERWGRETAKVYDGVRLGLALDAGVRAVLLAYAGDAAATLAAFAATATLRVGSATIDLPRTSLSDVAAAAQGAPVEVGGLVSQADFRIGAPSNRSVLTIGRSTQVRVLVPHVAVDSFGIRAGVWLQARGEAHPDGKDGIAGPVVMAGRVRREAAAQASFTDALVFAGRDGFALRPGELDLVAGRVAGDRLSMSEIGRQR